GAFSNRINLLTLIQRLEMRVASWQNDGSRRDLNPKPVADAADGFDLFRPVAQFLAQRFDVDVDRAFEHQSVVAHGGFHELMAAESASRLADEGPQQAKLGR